MDPRLEPAPSVERPTGPATLIVNPNAGRGRMGRALPDVEEALRRHGFDHRVALPRLLERCLPRTVEAVA